MTGIKLSADDAAEEFWKHLEGTRTVMLGVNATDQHSQPMTAFTEPGEHLLWFFTRDTADIARESADTTDARLTFMSKDEEVCADIFGELSAVHDPARVDRHWSPMVSAWYPEGKNDPHLLLLRFMPVQGQVWVSKQGLIRTGFAIARANLTKTTPDIGSVANVSFTH